MCKRFALTGLLVLLSLSYASADIQPPNIVLLLADDLGYQELGCYGQKWIKTPHIDSLARDGVRMSDFYSGNAVCAPSRCCLMTGKHPGHAYIRDNGDPKHLQHLKEQFGWEFPGQNPIPDAEVTLAEVLKQKNYATAAIGKWGLGHFGTTGDPNQQGFDLFYGFNCQRHAHNHYPRFLWRNRDKEILPGNDRTLYGETYSQDRFTEVALEFLRENRKRPFLLYMPYAIPHLSIQVPEKSLAEYRGVLPEAEYKHRGYLKHPHPRAGYAAMISHLDRDIGKILDELDDLGIADNTLVIFTSDNGPTYNRLGGSDSDFFESAGVFRGLKGSLYEGGIRVPLVARWPGKIPAGSVSDLPSAFWDLLPTLAEVTGTSAPDGIDGVSLLPTWTGQKARQRQRDHLYWEFRSYGGQQAVRRGKWKAIRQKMLARGNTTPLKIELYDLQNDPGEQNDVAEDHPELVAQFDRIMSESRSPSELFPIPPLEK